MQYKRTKNTNDDDELVPGVNIRVKEEQSQTNYYNIAAKLQRLQN